MRRINGCARMDGQDYGRMAWRTHRCFIPIDRLKHDHVFLAHPDRDASPTFASNRITIASFGGQALAQQQHTNTATHQHINTSTQHLTVNQSRSGWPIS